MAPVNANISINMETAKAQAQLRALQTQVTALNKSMAGTAAMGGASSIAVSSAAAAQGIKMQQGFTQSIVQTKTAFSNLDTQLAGSSRSIGASFKTMGSAFKKNSVEAQLAGRRAQEMGAQYTQVGKSVNGVATSVKQLPPLTMSGAAVGAQKMQIFTRAMNQGATSMINLGKNMQWAGRQMMVGFTLPLTILGGVAAKTFMDMEKQLVNFKRVYGDFDTLESQTDAMTVAIEEQAVAFTKWGITVSESIELAASAAATGLTGDDLLQTTEQATKLATLGMITQEQALDTMISLNSAFKINGSELAETVDFLNAVENQTVLALSDVTEAIPLVAPVIKGLGGDVQDLAVMLTAMREGGVGANEAANALKTGLARLVTPAKAARDRAEELGISLNKIVENNEGDLMGMVNSLAIAMKDLGDLDKQKLLSDLFGKRQFARMGALFTNLTDEASQAKRVIDLTTASAAELAALSEKELFAIEESSAVKFQAALEQIKVAIAPIGEAFLKLLTPILEFGSKAANWFNSIADNAKMFIGVLVVGLGAVVPAVIMFSGLLGNLIGSLLKGLSILLSWRSALGNSSKDITVLGTATRGLTMEQMATYTATEQLTNSELELNTALTQQATLVSNLTNQYVGLVAAQTKAAGGARAGARSPMMGPQLKMATGGKVPGAGSTDKVPALLTPGEFVVKKSQAGKHSGFLSALNNGSVKGFVNGGGVGTQTSLVEGRLLDWDIPSQEISNAISRGIKQGLSDAQIAKSLKSEFGPKASYGRFDQKGNVDVQAAHVYPQMQSDADGVSHALEAMEKGTIKLTKAQQVEIRNLDQANKALAKAGLPPVGKAALTTNATYSGEKMMNQALANGGLSGKETAASLGRTSNMGMSVISKQMSNAGKLSAAQIGKGATAMQKALEAEAAALSANTVVVDKATDEIVAKYKAAGKEVVEFGQIWDKAEKSIQKENAAFVKEQRLLQKEYAQLRIMTTKLTKAQEKVLADAGMSAKNVSRTSRAGNAVNRTVITGAAGTSDSRRGNVESKTILASTKAFDKVAGQLRKKGAFAVTNYNAGMMSKIPETTKTGSKVVAAAAKGIQVTQKSNSPAKLFAKLGVDAVAGYVNGILGGTSKAKNAGAKLAGSAAQGAAGSPQVNASAQQRNTAALNGSTASIQRVSLAARTQAVVIQGFNTVTLTATAALGMVARNAKKMGGALMRGSGKLSGVMGAATGAIFAMSMFEGPMQELSQKIMPFVFGLTAVQQLLPLFKSPWMIAIGAIVAIGGSLWYLNKLATDTMIAQREYTKALYGSAKEIESFGEFTGKTTKAEKDRLRKLNDAGAGVTKEELTQAQSFLQGDSGKEFLESIKMVQDRDGGNRAAKAVVDRLTRAVLQGSLSAELARAIASEVGVAMDNKTLGLVASVEINDIFGPDGKKLDVQDGIILYGKIIAEVELSDSIAAGGSAWDSSSMGAQLGMIFRGKGSSDLAAADAGAKFGAIAELAAEQLSLFNQAIVNGDIAAESFDENMDKLAKDQLNAYDFMLATKKAFEREFGEGSFGESEREEFVNALEADAQKTVNDVKGSAKGEGYFDDRNMKDLTQKVMDTEKAIDKQQKRDLKFGTTTDMSFFTDQLADLDVKMKELISFQGAIASGDFLPEIDGDIIDDIKTYNLELRSALSTRDEWLKSETQGGLLFDSLFGNKGETAGSGSELPASGLAEEVQRIRDQAQEATVLGMRDGFSPEKLFATMPSAAMPELVAAAKKMSTMLTDEWKELSKKDKKVFTVEFVTDTFDWNSETVELFEQLNPINRKKFILDFVTNVYNNGDATKDLGLSDVSGYGSDTELNPRLQAIIDAQNAGADTAFDGNDEENGGSKTLSWVEEQEKAYREASAIYGKVLKSKKGFMDQLVKGGKLDHEILKAAKGNFEAMKELASMSEKEQEAFNKKFMRTQLLNAQGSLEIEIAEAKRKTKAIKEMRNDKNGLTEEVMKFIESNENLMKLYSTGGAKAKRDAVDGANSLIAIAEAAKSPIDKTKDAFSKMKDLYSSMTKVIGASNTLIEWEVDINLGFNDKKLKRKTETLQAELALLEDSLQRQTDPLEDKIEAEQKIIDKTEREVELAERGLEVYENQIKALDKQVEQLNRADEIRMRESDMLSHDLKLMGHTEEQINETYSKRIESLTKVETINQQIAQSQQQQLGLASALSRGDVSAAASAAQQMQQGAMQNAAAQFKAQLETSKQSQIDSLTGAESGMTSDQIALRQRDLEEQSYFTKLKVRDLEDQSYNLNLLMSAEQEKIEAKSLALRANADAIYKLEQQILGINEDATKVLDDQIALKRTQILESEYQKALLTETNDLSIIGLESEAKMIAAVGEIRLNELGVLEAEYDQIQDNTLAMANFGRAAAAAYQAIKTGEFKFTGSGSQASAARSLAFKDSFKGQLEDVASLAAKSLMSTGSSPSFNIPGSAVGAKATSGIMGNITTNNNNVNVNAQGASAVEVADIVIRRLDMRNASNIGGAG